MAAANAVWGIDIGHCALKALRCGLADDGKTLVAEAFDYIEYPKLLTQMSQLEKQPHQDQQTYHGTRTPLPSHQTHSP